MPALDEEEAIAAVLAEIPRGLAHAVVVCDNGSHDGTARVAREAGAHVVREDRRGYGQACLTALDAVFARGSVEAAPGAPFEGDDVIVFLDADHSDYPEDALAIVAPIAAGEADFVIGSRVLGGASLSALLPQAWFGNRLACFLMRVLFGARYTDLGPFRAITAHALRHLAMRDRDFGWTVEMQLKAKVAGLRTSEVPVRYRTRIGRSKITGTLSGTLRAGWKILSWIVGWRLELLTPRRRIPTYRAPVPFAPR
ncbi:MAG: glycosyltransferase family 2 protein [bacterium]|nr:glycosyltransferase family 2 protein [bacterium]